MTIHVTCCISICANLTESPSMNNQRKKTVYNIVLGEGRHYVFVSSRYLTIATDRVLFFHPKMLISFLFLHKSICCGYSLEAPRRGASNEYTQHMFLWRNKKNIMCIPPLPVVMCNS